MKLGSIYISVQAKVDKLKRDLAKAKGMTQKTAILMQNAISKINFARVGVAAAAFTTAYAYGMKKAIDAASDLQEVQGKFDVVFKDHREQAEDMAKVLVESYAMSTREAKQYMSSVQDLLVPMGMAADRATLMSNEVVKLAADLGSFNNLPTATVMLDIQSALVGNFETMKKYGVVLNETVIKQKALDMGMWNGKGMVDANTKAQVAYKLMLEGSAAAIGDLERTQESYANQLKKLKANFEEIAATIGTKLLPQVTAWVKNLNIMIKNNPEFIDQLGDIAKNTLSFAAALGKVAKYAGLRSISGTFAEGAFLAKQNLLDWNKFVAATFTERQRMVDAISARNLAGVLDNDLNEATRILDKYRSLVWKPTPDSDSDDDDSAAKKAAEEHKKLMEIVAEETQKFKESKTALTELDKALLPSNLAASISRIGKEWEKADEAAVGSFQRWTESAKTFDEVVNDVGISIAETFANDFVDAILDADKSFKGFARNFIREIAKMIAKQALLNAIKAAGSSFFNASGNVYDQGGVTGFASGGVVNSPTVFPFAGGTGVMGEAGPEAIMPLSRGTDGVLGVKSSGSEPTTVNYVIQAIDSKSFIDTVRRNPEAITLVMNEQMQRGNSALNNNIRRVAQ